jgi:hypothetical protein
MLPSAKGTLSVTGGGTVSAKTLRNGPTALLAVDVGSGSRVILNSESASFSNLGTVRILAGASPDTNSTYAPISAPSWGTAGKYQAVGGKWNSTTHEFTTSAVQSGNSGVPLTIDRLSIQRTLISDAATHWNLGASFASTTTSSPLTFTATTIDVGPLNDLNGVLNGDRLLGGWTIASSTGYAAGDPIYLSFGINPGIANSACDLQLWSYDGTNWSKFSADDFTCDGRYASFTATKMGCYAVSVPEPSTACLLAFSILGLLAVAWKKRK